MAVIVDKNRHFLTPVRNCLVRLSALQNVLLLIVLMLEQNSVDSKL